jgi:hypothetical protein
MLMFACIKTLQEKLEDRDTGAVSCAVNVICELARKNPQNYLALAPLFFKLLTVTANNWMLIKIVKRELAPLPLPAASQSINLVCLEGFLAFQCLHERRM